MHFSKKCTVFLLINCLLLQVSLASVGFGNENCLCQDKSLCQALDVGPRQEVYGFATDSAKNWKQYDWDKLTTIAVFGKWSEELLCYAHSKVCMYSINKLSSNQLSIFLVLF